MGLWLGFMSQQFRVRLLVAPRPARPLLLLPSVAMISECGPARGPFGARSGAQNNAHFFRAAPLVLGVLPVLFLSEGRAFVFTFSLPTHRPLSSPPHGDEYFSELRQAV